MMELIQLKVFISFCKNSPQFIWVGEPEMELQFHYKVHTSLDVVEEKLSNVGTNEIRKLYLGLLHSTEEHKMYAFYTILSFS